MSEEDSKQPNELPRLPTQKRDRMSEDCGPRPQTRDVPIREVLSESPNDKKK